MSIKCFALSNYFQKETTKKEKMAYKFAMDLLFTSSVINVFVCIFLSLFINTLLNKSMINIEK